MIVIPLNAILQVAVLLLFTSIFVQTLRPTLAPSRIVFRRSFGLGGKQ